MEVLEKEDYSAHVDKNVYLMIHYWRQFGRVADPKANRDFFWQFLRPQMLRPLPPNFIASFWNPSHQNNSTLETFYRYLKHVKKTCGKEVISDEHYLPFVVLFQTSGSGKSFLVKSVAQKGIYVAYLNARSGGSGYPFLSPLFASGSIMKHLDENSQMTFTCFIQATLESIIACTAYGIEPTLFTRWMADPSFEGGSDFWEWLLNRIDKIWETSKGYLDWETKAYTQVGLCADLLTLLHTDASLVVYNEDKNGDASFSAPRISNFRVPAPSLFGRKASHPRGNLENVSFIAPEKMSALEPDSDAFDGTELTIDHSKKPSSDAPLVIFAMDELSSLTEQQRLDWRRACCVLPKSIVCLPAMMDTVSTVSVIAPEKINDPSARMRDAQRDTIFPFYWLSIFSNSINVKDGIDLDKLAASYDLDLIGRPLWAAYGDDHVYRRDVALQKLMGKGTIEEASRDGKLALLACRFPLEINSFDLTNNMVGHHLRYCQYLSEDRSAIMSAYASEPILPCVSSFVTRTNEKFEMCLETIASHIRSGAVSVGDRGETAAAILIQRAFDIAAANEDSKSSIKFMYPFAGVENFMNVLLPGSLFKELEGCIKEVVDRTSCSSVFTGRCFFNHFVQLYERPGKELLVQLAARCAAAFARRNEFGFDLLVPIIMPDVDGSFIIAEANMSYMMIQVKNRESGDGDFKKSSVAKLASPVGLEALPEHMYILLCMSLSNKWKTSASNWKAQHLLPLIESTERDTLIQSPDVFDIMNFQTEDQRDTSIYRKMAQNQCGLDVKITGTSNEVELRKIALNAWNRHRQIAVQTFGISHLFDFLTPKMCDYIEIIARPLKDPALMPDSQMGLQQPFIEATFFPGYVQRVVDNDSSKNQAFAIGSSQTSTGKNMKRKASFSEDIVLKKTKNEENNA